MRRSKLIRILAVTLCIGFPGALPLMTADPATGSHWASEVDGWFLEQKTPWRMGGTSGSSFTPDGRQAILALTNGGLAIVELRSQKIRSVLDFSAILGHDEARPGMVAISPLGFIAAAFPERNEILLIDRARMRISERIRTAFMPMTLRFSARGGYLFIGASADGQGAQMIYGVRQKQTILSRIEPMIADMSRDDRYLYLYDQDRNSIRWIVADTMETVRYFNLTALTPAGRPLALRVLRDHTLALGFRGSLILTDRYLGQSLVSHHAEDLAISCIEPSHDNRLIIFGDGRQYRVLALDNNISRPLPLPQGARSVSVYPGGNYLIYSDPAEQRTGIMRINVPSRFNDPSSTSIDRR